MPAATPATAPAQATAAASAAKAAQATAATPPAVPAQDSAATSAAAPLPSCGALAPGVVVEPTPLVDRAPAYRARRSAEDLLAVCTGGAWHLVPLEDRQLADSHAFEVTLTEARLVDRTGDGAPELEIIYHFIESLTPLPPTGPRRQADGVVLLALTSAAPRELLRFYVRGATNTAVAYGEATMAGAHQWVETVTGPILSIVQSVAVTEDAESGDAEHGTPETRIEEAAATFRWSDEATSFEQQGAPL